MTKLEAVHEILCMAQVEALGEVDLTVAIVMAYTLVKHTPEEQKFYEALGVLIGHEHGVLKPVDALVAE